MLLIAFKIGQHAFTADLEMRGIEQVMRDGEDPRITLHPPGGNGPQLAIETGGQIFGDLQYRPLHLIAIVEKPFSRRGIGRFGACRRRHGSFQPIADTFYARPGFNRSRRSGTACQSVRLAGLPCMTGDWIF